MELDSDHHIIKVEEKKSCQQRKTVYKVDSCFFSVSGVTNAVLVRNRLWLGSITNWVFKGFLE